MGNDWIQTRIDICYLQGQIIQLYKTRNSISEEIDKKEKELEIERAKIKKEVE
tara:strand:+ start:79 stop:237 length:159 start_codon:yes stop_codon:yes gene_type:complete